MLGKKPKAVNHKLESAIERILDDMLMFGPDSPEYPDLLGALERMQLLRNSQEKRKLVDPNAVVTAAGSILGILVIVAYEQKHVMTSKGLGFILKPK